MIPTQKETYSILFALFFLISFGSVLEHTQLKASLITQEELRLVARAAIEDQEDLLSHAFHTLDFLSKLPAIQTGNAWECSRTLGALLRDEENFLNVGAIRKDGRLLCSGLPAYPGLDLSDRAYFSRALESGTFAVGDYQTGRITKKQSINFGYPFKNENGETLGVVFLSLNLDSLHALQKRATLPQGAEIMVTDNNGITLARFPQNIFGVIPPEFDFTIDNFEYIEKGLGIIEVTNGKKQKRFLVVAPLSLPNQEGFLHLIISVPKESIIK